MTICAFALAAALAPKGHSHNDYYRERPLLDAYAADMVSVEADVFLVDGELLVGHDRDELTPERTLEALYLGPLRPLYEEVETESLILLVDIKDDGEASWRALRELLAEEYRDLLATDEPGPVRVVISGNRPIDLILEDEEHLTSLDGRIEDLERYRHLPYYQMPLVSASWWSQFQWNGMGVFPVEEREKLGSLVEQVQGQGRKLRFWAHPDVPTVWDELYGANVDLINTDRPAALGEFLSDRD